MKKYRHLALEVIVGYGLQLTSMSVLAAQSFLLPALIGLAQYGIIGTIIGGACLIHCYFDHGYNLLMVKRVAFAGHYFAAKIILTFLSISSFLIVMAFQGEQNFFQFTLPVAICAAFYVIYTYVVYNLYAHGKNLLVAALGIIAGISTIFSAVIFRDSKSLIVFSPAIAFLATICVAVLLKPEFMARALVVGIHWLPRVRIPFLLGSFLRQLQLSIVTMVDGVLVWMGFFMILSNHGIESAAIFRIAMSVVALLAQLMPTSKQMLMRIRTRVNLGSSLILLFSLVLLVGIVQLFCLYFTFEAATKFTNVAIKDNELLGLYMLAPIPILRALLDILSIYSDEIHARRGMLLGIGVGSVTFIASIIFVKNVHFSIISFYFVATVAAWLFIQAYKKPRKVMVIKESSGV